jgi:hypothetical protein
MSESVLVLGEGAGPIGQPHRLLWHVGGLRQMLMTRGVRLVAGGTRHRGRGLVGDRRHDVVDEPLGRPAQPSTATGPDQGTKARHTGDGRADHDVPAPVPHLGLALSLGAR